MAKEQRRKDQRPKDERPPERERQPIWSVAGGWLPWYLLLFLPLLFSWAAFVVGMESVYGDYLAFGLLVKGIIIEISSGVIGIVVFCLAVITAADTGGGAFVVTYRYLNNKFVEPLRRQLRQEGREEGIEEGREEGIEQGLEQGIEQGIEEGIERGRQEGREEGMAQGIERGRQEGREEGIEQGIAQGREQILEFRVRTLEWYARQQRALARGEPFDEPPPFIGAANGKDPGGE